MSALLRLGTVPYLNAQPLVAGLDAQPGVVLERAVPSQLVDRLRAGALDAALVSAVELFRAPQLHHVAGPAITSCGPVRSILLFVRGAPERVRRLALDSSSRSAAALARICLSEFLGARALTVTECGPEQDLAATGADAVLRIGDPALAAAHERGLMGAPARTRDGWHALDLGTVWTAHTGLPFVYALWLVRPTVPAGPLRERLLAAREAGLPQRDALADAFAARSGLPADACRTYLKECIGFDLGPAERAGLAAFGFLAHRHGLVASPVVPEALDGSAA
jgi:chorismate dehydratase